MDNPFHKGRPHRYVCWGLYFRCCQCCVRCRHHALPSCRLFSSSSITVHATRHKSIVHICSRSDHTHVPVVRCSMLPLHVYVGWLCFSVLYRGHVCSCALPRGMIPSCVQGVVPHAWNGLFAELEVPETKGWQLAGIIAKPGTALS